MLRGGDVNDIHEFKRQGLSISQISSLTGFDRKTIRKYLSETATPRYTPRYGPRPPRGSKLNSFKPYIRERLAAGVWNARVLLRELTERGYTGKYTVLTDYLRPLRKEAVSVAVRRFETPPGHQDQAIRRR
jgi:transposase